MEGASKIQKNIKISCFYRKMLPYHLADVKQAMPIDAVLWG